MSSDRQAPVVSASQLSKSYQIYNHPRDRLLQAIWRGKRKFYRDFRALQPISFKLEKGTTLGIVGRNGSGKSTLLQLICGTLTPSSGAVNVKGRIAALLELGSGFNPNFTGRENVYLNATLLGLSLKETDARLDNILSFADIGDYIDQPVKTYSSGMVVRLAFAVQAHIDPDLLVVDEALAVGDELFQKKCYSRLEKLKERGASIILVTHSCPQIIQHCDQALLLHKGKSWLWGNPARVTTLYQRLINAADDEWDNALSSEVDNLTFDENTIFTAPRNSKKTNLRPKHDDQAVSEAQTLERLTGWLDPNLKPDSTVVYPDRGIRIEELRVESITKEAINVIPFGESFSLCFQYYSDDDLRDIAFGCHIADHKGLRITGQTHPSPQGFIKHISAHSSWVIRFQFHGGLWPGVYFIGGGIWAKESSNSTYTPRYLHRVIDYAAIRIVANHPVNSIGACSLQLLKPELSPLLGTPLELSHPEARP